MMEHSRRHAPEIDWQVLLFWALVGGGVEYAFAPQWSAKLEYDYLGLRSWNWNSVVFPGDTFTASRNISVFKAGINYRFGWNATQY
jgi:outer membrane immunogenic protein